MSDEAQRLFVRVVLWAVFILVVVSLIGVVYYFMAIRPSMEQQPSRVPVQTESTTTVANQQAVVQTLKSTSTVQPQTLKTNQQAVEQSLQNSTPPSQSSIQANQQAAEKALNGK